MNRKMKIQVTLLLGILFVGVAPAPHVRAANSGNGELLDALNAALYNIIQSGKTSGL